MDPLSETYPRRIDRFEIEGRIASGGMGDIFLAYDPLCQRRVALKRIRKKLLANSALKKRFLREAKIGSRLSHPSIIPIFEVKLDAEIPYYTMPHIEGQTLKQRLSAARKLERRSPGSEDHSLSIPQMIRQFIAVCHAVHYVHSCHILHRDLKPENIIIGKYGEVLVLDWGLAEFVHTDDDLTLGEQSAALLEEELSSSMTIPGRIIGTVTYLAPERVQGEPTSVSTDIYALGVILYQILALKLPFRRPSIKEFTQNVHLEKVVPPSEAAPYRDIPPALEKICMRCIEPSPSRRYRSMEELIQDLDNYCEGRSEWSLQSGLDVKKGSDWAVEADVALTKHLAISRSLGDVQWVHVKISKIELTSNCRLTARVKIGAEGSGLGFLTAAPDPSRSLEPRGGFCLWLSAEKNQPSQLFRSNIQVLESHEMILRPDQWYDVRLELIDQKLHCYLDGELKFTYVSYLPVVGNRTGLLCRDAEFHVDSMEVWSGNLSSVLDCLAIPDAFLAHGDFAKAYSEYQKIAHSFPGRREGRMALYQSGICLLEEAKEKGERALFDRALDAFSALSQTSGAPLELLGKGLVYEALGDEIEMAGCFELAVRKYKSHPLLAPIKEQIHHKLHSVSGTCRVATYRLLLIVASLLPELLALEDNQRLISILKKDWDHLPFFEETSCSSPIDLAVRLSFWLEMPAHLVELVRNTSIQTHQTFIENALFALIEMDEPLRARRLIDELPSSYCGLYPFRLLAIAARLPDADLKEVLEAFFAVANTKFRIKEIRILKLLITRAIETRAFDVLESVFKKIGEKQFQVSDQIRIDALRAYVLMMRGSWEAAKELLENHPQAALSDERSSLFPLWACALAKFEGKSSAERHLKGAHLHIHPPITALLALPDGASQQLFTYEKKYLAIQQSLYEYSLNEKLTN